jgi:hypothetical protein
MGEQLQPPVEGLHELGGKVLERVLFGLRNPARLVEEDAGSASVTPALASARRASSYRALSSS